MGTPYVELHCHSNYSFLDGASHPEELVERAVELGMPALGITDHGGVYGAVKFVNHCRRVGIRPVVGAELEVDGRHLLLIARSMAGWSSLTRLLSHAHRDQPKGEARTTLEKVAELHRDLFCLTGCRPVDQAWLRSLQDVFGRESVFVELHNHLRPEDAWLAAGQSELARRCGARTVATNNVHYHVPSRRPLHDVLVAIRNRMTLEEARGHLKPNSEYFLKSGAEMGAVLGAHPDALAAGYEIAQACDVSLDFRDVRFPGFKVPEGETPFSFLHGLVQDGARERYHPITPAVSRRLQKELDVIDKTGLAEFFLINWDLMRFAKENGVPGQGRGSAADSIVAYVLGITRVDPIEHNLLFERFLHEEMTSTPDIDIDFSTAHREQIIQYVYQKYGWERTGMVCNVVTFQPRMAARQVGKALGFPPDVVDRLAKSVDSWFPGSMEETAAQAGFEQLTGSAPWRQFTALCNQVLNFPRHLSIHVGGMLVTGEPLIDIAPVEPATMPGRVVVQFDKDDVEDLGLIKMDMLGLRTLSVIAECLDLAKAKTGSRPDLDRLPLDDPEVYRICGEADTIGVFQIESRAQMQTLPRTRPAVFNDLVVEVAIIRPGPIQGNAVHPYIRRKQGKEEVTYAHPLLEPILHDTLGVILYQEQILEICIAVAGMTAGSADRFRRAMNRHRSRIEMASLHDGFVEGCLRNDVPGETAEDLFHAIEGFAAFGFCRSHAAAFARTSYETVWLKLHHPTEYYCGLLNNQPMGFYHPSVLVEDAKRHGVPVLPVDVNRSADRCLPVLFEEGGKFPPLHRPAETLPPMQPPWPNAVRLGFNYVKEMGAGPREAIFAERSRGDFTSFDDFQDRMRRKPPTAEAIQNLVMVGAFESLGIPRRELLWRWQEGQRARGRKRGIDPQASFHLDAAPPPLGEVTPIESTRLEYAISELSTGRHLVHYWRDRLEALGVLDSIQAKKVPTGRTVRVGGLVIVRQAPGTAKKLRFFTLEDELGHVNVTFMPDVYERYRKVANSNSILVVEGVMQRQDEVHSVLARSVIGLQAKDRELPTSHDYR
ncbi:MAG TPA: error-prone DNA polymerase [Candidatus Dormibacteraeota bacterium]|nr:error-prone DNA polymerase [Candidatus Dormibacteraeota bacterium]